MRSGVLFYFVAAVAATPSLRKRSENIGFWKDLTPTAGSLEWTQCEGEGLDERYSCALFEIPLDYKNPEAGKGRIAVAKYAAAEEKRAGTLFTNPGGPGVPGISFILSSAELLNNKTGGIYDIVSWDPRGVGDITFPGAVTCFNSSEEYFEYWDGSIEATFGVRGNFTEEEDIENFYSQMDDFEKRVKGMGEQCASLEGGRYLEYVGTAAAVRDMVALADAIDGKGKSINYWGFSYGTTIGSFFINMFPDRVGRVILDGCQDPKLYSIARADLDYQTMVESTDEAFQGFAIECARAGPSRCALADPEVTGGKDIMMWVQEDLINYAYDLSKAGKLPSAVASDIRSLIWGAMYDPATWYVFAEDLTLIRGDLALAVEEPVERRALTHRLHRRQVEDDDVQVEEGVQVEDDDYMEYSEVVPDNTMDAVLCGDSVDPGDTTTKMVFDEFVRVAHEVSGTFGPGYLQPRHKCHAWPARAVERFQGPFNHRLANPILVIGNTADPVTPFINAKAVADDLGDDATLIRQNGFGHATLAQVSECISNIVLNYWVKGTRPEGDDTVCKVDDMHELFPKKNATTTSPSDYDTDEEASTDFGTDEETGPDGDATNTSSTDLDLEIEASVEDDMINESSDGASGDEYESGTETRRIKRFHSRLDQLEEENKTLLISTIAFAGVASLMFIGLIVQFVLSRSERKRYQQVSQATTPQWTSTHVTL